MIEQVSNSLVFLAHFTVSAVAGTGLTITCTVYKASDGSTVVSAQACTEIGGGLYKYTLASGSTASADEYVAVFNEAAATADQQDIPALWVVGRAGVENLDANIAGVETKVDLQATAIALAALDTKHDLTDAALAVVDGNVDAIKADTDAYLDAAVSSRMATGSVTITAPVDSSTNALALVQGDSYLKADDREVAFTSSSWPNLTAATAIVLTIRKRAAKSGLGTTLWATIAHRSAGLVSGTGSQTIEFEPSVANTTALATTGTAAGTYDVQATLASGSIATLVTGQVNVTQEQTRV